MAKKRGEAALKTIPAFYFAEKELRTGEAALKKSYRTASPFPFFMVDDFLPRSVLKTLIKEFPKPRNPAWKRAGPGRTWGDPKAGEKLGLSTEESFGPFTRHFMAQLNSITFLQHIERVTGLTGLMCDPRYGGGGLHSTGRGGRLMIHTDQNRHASGNPLIHQVLNGILYLNEDWREDYGGELELWNSKRICKQKITPIANRFVLFSTGSKTLHGHPSPVMCPAGRRRNSIAVYYYVVQRPDSDDYTGFQQTVNWIPSTPADHVYSAAIADRLAKWVASQHGKVVLPSDDVTVPLFMFNEKKLTAAQRSKINTPEGLTAFAAAGVDKFSSNAQFYFYDREGRILRRTPQGAMHFEFFGELLLPE